MMKNHVFSFTNNLVPLNGWYFFPIFPNLGPFLTFLQSEVHRKMILKLNLGSTHFSPRLLRFPKLKSINRSITSTHSLGEPATALQTSADPQKIARSNTTDNMAWEKLVNPSCSWKSKAGIFLLTNS